MQCYICRQENDKLQKCHCCHELVCPNCLWGIVVFKIGEPWSEVAPSKTPQICTSCKYAILRPPVYSRDIPKALRAVETAINSIKNELGKYFRVFNYWLENDQKFPEVEDGNDKPERT